MPLPSAVLLNTSSKLRRDAHSSRFKTSWTIIDLLLEQPGIDLGYINRGFCWWIKMPRLTCFGPSSATLRTPSRRITVFNSSCRTDTRHVSARIPALVFLRSIGTYSLVFAQLLRDHLPLSPKERLCLYLRRGHLNKALSPHRFLS